PLLRGPVLPVRVNLPPGEARALGWVAEVVHPVPVGTKPLNDTGLKWIAPGAGHVDVHGCLSVSSLRNYHSMYWLFARYPRMSSSPGISFLNCTHPLRLPRR